ncbi:multidrug ABC transporter [Vulcanimicrobium alpinum]|uniref:Multidrug ABC transporter n=1 Tax=Vulcanimicrobium alpinum TaxID=3016050 RepID=A0AAN1XY35_UNVUL|nr:efflux RND transporter permease subunit [Vulcanimicrobium alpinum]BDE07531.1 multidrug ABC transporter [Vulcanimicrobium alpinum]
MSIADFAVTRRVTVAMLATAIVVLGIFAIPRLPIALLPSFQPPVVSVTVNYGNVSPETMESTVTRPIENAVSRVSGIDYLQSNSFQGQTVVRATFKYGTNINVAATDIQQQVARAATQLPNDTNLQQPQIQKADPNALPVVRLSVTDNSRPLRDLFDLFNNQLADEFAGVSGVGSVSVFGGAQRAIMVEPDVNALAGYGLDTNAIVTKIKNENVDAPAGLLAIGPKEFTIRANALYKNSAEVANTVVTVKNGAPVYVRDVARVIDGVEEIRSFSRLDGNSSIALGITAQPDANVIAVSQGVYAKIADFQKRYPTMHFGVVFDQQGFIDSAVVALEHTAVYGAILAVLIILLFLHSLRSTLIVAVSLPTSVLGTFFAAYTLHQSLNIMTLGGLALAVGLIVDDAVVVIENIYRHLAEGEPPREAARNATAQIFTAVLASTVTVITVFVPLLLIPGLQGLIFGPFALVIIVGVGISLLVATTTVPMLSSFMLDTHSVHLTDDDGDGVSRGGFARGFARRYQRFGRGFDRFYLRLETGYRRLLGAAVDRPAIVLGTGLLLVALSIVAVNFGVVKTEVFPASSSRFIRLNLRTPNGTSVASTNAVAIKVEDALRRDPRVVSVADTVGSAFGGGGSRVVTNQASMAIALRPGISGAKADAFVTEWQRRLGGTPRRGGAANANVPQTITPEQRAQFLDLRRALVGTQVFASSIDIVQQTVSQGSDAIEIQLYGPDINQLYKLAQGAIPSIAQIPGIQRPDTNITPSQPEVDVNVNRRMAAQLGLSTGDIANVISTATSGTIASYWQTNGTQYPILVQLPPDQRRSLDALNSLQILPSTATLAASSGGGSGSGTSTNAASANGPSSQSLDAVPLSGVAQITIGQGPSQIPRQNKSRRVDIDAPLVGGTLGDVLAQVTKVMDAYPLPAGYRWQYGPSVTQNNNTFGALTLVVILAIALIYMLLASQFESFLDPLVIMVAVPFALIGIVGSLWITHRAFGLTAFIGSLMLVGIAVKNAILVVEFTKQLRRDEGYSAREALMHAGPMRLRPILMTTLATLGGMLPIALGLEAGSETQAPLGTVVIGGLVTSTLLSLVVVPTIYLLVAKHIEPRFAPKPPSFRRPTRPDGAPAKQPHPAAAP